MATNHSNIGSYFAEKHLSGLTKMVVNAKKSKGEELFKPGGSPEGTILLREIGNGLQNASI